MIRTRWVAVSLLTLFLAGCASGGTGGFTTASQSGRDFLTRDQVLTASSGNVYDAILALRTNWLTPRGVDSFNAPGQVQAYVDNVRLDGVESLRAVHVNDVESVRYFDGTEATARWGLDHGHGAIYVSTR